MLVAVKKNTWKRKGALTPEQDERVRVVVGELIGVAGSQRGLAAALEKKGFRITQQSIGRHMSGAPAGRGFAEKIAASIGVPYLELINGRETPGSAENLLNNLSTFDIVAALESRALREAGSAELAIEEGIRRARETMGHRGVGDINRIFDEIRLQVRLVERENRPSTDGPDATDSKKR